MRRSFCLRCLGINIVLVVLLFIVFETVLMPKRILDVLDTFDDNYEYFYGPSKVHKIPEDHFPATKFPNKYFIYDCSSYMCGGLADRQQGIVAAYLIAQMMGRKFGVVMTVPCNIDTVLDENKAKWIVSPNLFNKPNVLSYKYLDHQAWNLRKTFHEIDLEQRFNQDVVRFLVNQEFVKYLMKLPRFQELKWAQNKTAMDIYNIVLHRLFKLKPVYQELFKKFQLSVRSKGRQLVCAHIRLNDFASKSELEKRTDIPKVWTFLSQYNDTEKYRIFVSTSEEFLRDEARRLFPEVFSEIKGPIIHIDYGRFKGNCAGLAKTVLDQLILSTCDIMLHPASGYSRVAAMLRGTDNNVFKLSGERSYFNNENFFPSWW